MLLDFETKSLRDTRDILTKACEMAISAAFQVSNLKDAFNYVRSFVDSLSDTFQVDANPHPRLWRPL